MAQKAYWEQVYATHPADELGWYEPHLQTSLRWTADLGLVPDTPLIDVGGGASTLVDDLLGAGHRSITVLDLSAHALATARQRLGDDAQQVTWIEGDVTAVDLPEAFFGLWHDRAVLHFLTDGGQQRRYRDALRRSLRAGGHVIIGTFAAEAPAKCSGLPVRRYDPQALHHALGEGFDLLRDEKVLHVTPGGVEQMYLYCCFRRKG